MSRTDSAHLSEVQRAEYVDRRLAGAALVAAERHLQQCAACSVAVKGEQDVAALLRRLPPCEPPRSFVLPEPLPRSGWSRAAGWLRYASGLAAVFLVVVLAADLLITPPRAEPRAEVASEAAPLQQPAPALAPALRSQADTGAAEAQAKAAGAEQPPVALQAPSDRFAPAPTTVAARAEQAAEQTGAADAELPLAMPEASAPAWAVQPRHVLLAALAMALAGTALLFDRRARRP